LTDFPEHLYVTRDMLFRTEFLCARSDTGGHLKSRPLTSFLFTLPNAAVFEGIQTKNTKHPIGNYAAACYASSHQTNDRHSIKTNDPASRYENIA
jgi:hypothetical protein